MPPVLVFDLETVPDVAGLRRVWSMPDSLTDAEVAQAAFDRRREKTGHEFLPLHLQRVVAVGCLFRDGDTFALGSIEARAIHTPGHTPACMTYLIGDAAFVGDTLFMPDYGTARCDFPGGDARQLYRSIRKLFALPDATRLFLCHDYKAPGRDEYRWETTVGEEKAHNVHVHDGISEDAFVAMRTARDATLGMPKLILPSVQVNMRAGQMPPAEDNGRRYLKIPVDVF